MKCTMEFSDFGDMLEFANQLIGQVVAPAPVVQPAHQAAPVVQETPQPMPQQPAPQPTPAPAVTTIPTTQPSYTLDNLANAAMTLMDAGRQDDLLQLLASFGAESLPVLPQAQYGAFATALRGLGAQI